MAAIKPPHQEDFVSDEHESVGRAPTTWVFDVDGCLIDSLSGTSLRPGAYDLLCHLRDRGCDLVLWSAGGAAYARERATITSISEFFHAFRGKDSRDEDGWYVLDHLQVDVAVAVFVDDRPEDLPPIAEVLAVSPYLSHAPHDRGLEPIMSRAGMSRNP